MNLLFPVIVRRLPNIRNKPPALYWLRAWLMLHPHRFAFLTVKDQDTIVACHCVLFPAW